MGTRDDLVKTILGGRSDANIAFTGLCNLLRRLGEGAPAGRYLGEGCWKTGEGCEGQGVSSWEARDDAL
jgi:hypothetical protein